jgi:Gluconate 2-dehydrogenase subunit 3
MRATSKGRAVAPLRCLLPDEAAFIDAAFERILPEASADGLKVSASRYVDAKLAPLAAHAEGPASNSALTLYRTAIAAVQAHCERRQGRRFQALPVWQQLAVLAQLERSADKAHNPHGCLIDWLLNDAAEAYFDVAARPFAAVAEARLAVAA